MTKEKNIEEVDHSKMKLGKLPPKHDPRTFKLSEYLRKKKLPEIPDEWNWGHKIDSDKWGMMHNHKIDICTCAAAGHFVMAWTSNTGKLIKPRDKEVLKAYSAVTGYDPKTGKNDTGAYSLDVLKYWRKNYIDKHKIFAFAALKLKNRLQLKQTTFLFGGCYAGFGLPLSAMKQNIWAVPPEGKKGKGKLGSWSGHAVLIIGYSPEGLRVITWGKEKIMTWDFWDAYCEESYAVFSDDFIKDNKTPAGIDVHALREDLAALKKKKKNK
jgi:hypothetical protein